MPRLRAALLCLVAAAPLSAVEPAEVEKAILAATNAYRVKQDRGKLTLEPTLSKIARGHAREMAKRDQYGDDDSNGHILDGKGPADRAKAGGYAFGKLLENVGWNKGHDDPAKTMMQGWIDSPGHRKNLEDADITELGLGAAQGQSGRWYFVQLFGRPHRLQTRVEVTIENRTAETIAFQVGAGKYQLPPGVTGRYRASQGAGQIEYRITWPDAGEDRAETGTLTDGARYAFVKDGGRYRFKRLGKPE